MQKEHNVSIIKFKTIPHGENRQIFFYPAIKIYNKFEMPEPYNKQEYARNSDHHNKKTLFQYMKYNEDLKKYFDKAEEFNSQLWLKKGQKLKSFYNLMCDYILTLTTNLYYKEWYKFESDNTQPLEFYLSETTSEALIFHLIMHFQSL